MFSSALGTLIVGASNVVGPLIAMSVIDRIGRKTLIFGGFVGCLIGLLMLLIAFIP